LRRPTEQVFPNIKAVKFFTQKMLPQLETPCMWKVPSFDERIFHAGRCFNHAVLYFIIDHFALIRIWRKISVILEHQVAQLMIYEFRIRKKIKLFLD
jgi:hypothetical protein